MGKSSKHFKSAESANNFASKVNGTVRDISQGKPGNENFKEHHKVEFETWGQSQTPRHYKNNYQDDFDHDGYTHTSEDI